MELGFLRKLVPTPARRELHRQRQRRANDQRLQALLADPPSRRVEVGSGAYPTPGFIHVDIDQDAVDVDLVMQADELPFPPGWADEIRAVHVVEHISPWQLLETLRRWHDLLRPGGIVDIHVPNGAALARAILRSAVELDEPTIWRANAAIYGYTIDPRTGGRLSDLRAEPEHRLLYTWPVLKELMRQAGFTDVTVPDRHECRHNGPWDPYIPELCLRVTARR